MFSENLPSDNRDGPGIDNARQISLCFPKIIRGLDNSKLSNKNENIENEKKIKLELKKYQRGLASPLSVNALQKQNCSPRKLKKNNQFTIAALISILGKLLIFVKSVKKLLLIKEMKGITMKQIEFLNDLAYPIDTFEEKCKKEKLHKYRSKILINIVIRMLFFIDQSLSKALSLAQVFHLKSLPVFLPSNRIILTWKLVICVVILYEFFFIPLQLLFIPNRNYVFSKVIEDTVRIIFWVDLIIDTNTAVYKKGEIIGDRKQIFKKYFRGQLVYQLLTNILLFIQWGPDDETTPLMSHSSWNILKLLFFIRVRQVSLIFNQVQEILNRDETFEALFELIKLILQIFFITHIFCSLWAYAATQARAKGENSWQDQVFFNNNAGPVSLERQYLYAFYWSLATVITVGYGDIAPKNDGEVIISSLAMLFGSGFFAYGINKIGAIFEKFKNKNKEFRNQFRIIKTYMQKKKIDYETQVRVFKYLKHLFKIQINSGQDMESRIISRLSKNLQKDILHQANGNILANNFMFMKNFSLATIEKLSQKVQTINYAPEEIIYREGVVDDGCIYFLTNGEVEIKTGSSSSNPNWGSLSKIKEGESFGQEGFFSKQARRATALSKTFSSVLAIKETDFRLVVSENKMDWEVFHMLRDKILIYQEHFILNLKCESCGELTHSINNCPYIGYFPNKWLVLQRYLYDNYQNRNAKFRRKRASKATNCLLNKYEHPVVSDRSLRSSSEESSNYFSTNGLNMNNQISETEMDFDAENKRKEFHRKQQRKNSRAQPVVEQTEEKESNHTHEMTQSVNLVEHNETEGSPLEITKRQQMSQKYVKKFTTESTSYRTNVKEYPAIDNNYPTIFGGINTDKINSFEYYFPYNNCEKVIAFHANIAKLTKRKGKQKIVNDQIDLKLQNQNNNTLKMNPNQRGRFSGLFNQGLIHYRNLQRFFLQTKDIKK